MRGARGFGGVLAAGAFAAGAMVVFAPPVVAQCTLASAPVPFEPMPPGVPRPYTLYAGYNYDFQLYRSSGAPRMLMMESFGYSVLDVTNPLSPTALLYDDMRFEGVAAHGDGQTYIASLGVSDDGQRAAFSINGPGTPPWGTVVGQPTGFGFTPLGGDFAMCCSTKGTVVQHVGSRYIAYGLAGGVLAAADVTALPGLSAGDIASERVPGVPGGSSLALAGNKVVVAGTGSGTIVIDASNPGPAGNISSRLTQVLVTPADWGMATDADWVSAAADPSDPTKTWLLAEFPTSPPTYKLMSVQGSTKSLSPRAYQIPGNAGDVWYPAMGSGLVPGASGLVALMWAQRRSPTVATQLHSAPIGAWSTATFGVIDLTSYAIPMRTLKGFAGPGNAVYTYTATGGRAYVIPLSCLTVPAPPLSDMTVEPVPCPGASPCPLNPNDTVFVGQTLKVTPTVFSMHSLTDWRFDYDWHTPAEDNGTSPRLRSPDLAYPTAGAVPPATITLAGPCDPAGGGVPATGAGCWASVTSNGDFASGAPAGTTATLTLALEASNDLGAGNTKSFPLTWKVPAVRLQNTSVLLSQPLQSAAEGAPLASGYRWYFGTSPTSLALSACTGPSCLPPSPYNAKGTYYYWLTVPYASYTSPDCGTPCTRNLGTYTVADVSVSITNVPTTVLASHAVNLTDASSIAGGVTACGATGWQYGLCDASAPACTAGTGLSWTDIAIPHPGSASFTAPSIPATYWLRVRYNYTTTGACPSLSASWTPAVPGISDITAWPLVVTPIPPTIVVRVNGQDPCPPGPGGACTNGYPANVGDIVSVWADLQGIGHDPSPPATTLWTFGPTASPSSCAGSGCQGTSFAFTQAGNPTISLTGYPGVASPSLASFAVDVPPVVARNGGPVCAGSPLPLTASPTISGATYAWTGPNGFTSTAQNPTIPAATSAAAGTYVVVRTLYGQQTQSTTVASVGTPPSAVIQAPGAVCLTGAGATASVPDAGVGVTYAWTIQNGTITFGHGTPSITFTAASAGATTLGVTVTSGPCSVAGSASVPVATACTPAQLVTVVPCRAIDTRLPAGTLGGPGLAPVSSRGFALAGVCGIPANAVAISVTITATDAGDTGSVVLYPGTGAAPNVNGVSFRPGVARANNMIVPVSGDGTATFSASNTSGGTVAFILDVNGFFQ